MTRAGASFVVVFVVACGVMSAKSQERAAEHPGGPLLEPMCGTCHDTQTVTEIPRTKDDWTETLDQMIRFGAQGTDEDFNQLVDYLLRNHSLVNVNKAPAASSRRDSM